MADTTTLQETGLGTVAKYKLTAETSGIDLSSAQRWVFSVEGTQGTIQIASDDPDDDKKHVVKDNGDIYVFINTALTGIGILRGRVRIEIEDTDYPTADNIRPEVSVPFDVIKVV